MVPSQTPETGFTTKSLKEGGTASPPNPPPTLPPDPTSRRALTRPRSSKRYLHQRALPRPRYSPLTTWSTSRHTIGLTRRTRQWLSQVRCMFDFFFFFSCLMSLLAGSPAIWIGREVPFTLEPDDSSIYVDQNTAQMSQYPILPVFAAADAIQGPESAPPVDWPTVDVITDRNGLRKFMRWLNPSPGRQVRDFRIDVELVGTKTLVLGRWDGRTREPPSGRSYGFGFENATTQAAPGCPSSGHHRAITYVRHHSVSFFFNGTRLNVPFLPIGYARYEDGGSVRGRCVLAE